MTENKREELDRLIAARRLAEARMTCDALITQSPDDLDLLYTAGMLAAEAKDLPAAVSRFLKILEKSPREAAAYFHLARAYSRRGKRLKAIAAYRAAVVYQPRFAEAHAKLAFEYVRCGQPLQAREHYEAALKAKPAFENSHYHLLACKPGDEYYELFERRHRAEALRGLANIDAAFCRSESALHRYREVVESNADSPWDRSNLLFHLAYNVLCGPEELLREHRKYDASFGGSVRAETYRHDRSRGPDDKLKIGYVSPDFRNHAVSYFFEPILKAHDRTRVEVYCYAEVSKPDEVTERLKGEADHWRTTVGLSDEAVARQIHEDGIDILVDLAGHTAHNRLGVFTYKPAPVQVTYLGYFTSTGLEAMDYWLTDEVLTPADTVERATEEIWRLGRCCLVYEAPAQAPEVVSRPRGEPVVFGSFNALSKVSEEAVALWSAVLRAVPGSRLLLKTYALGDELVRAEMRARFASRGIGADRLDLRNRTAGIGDHFGLYGEMDIALDTVPRTGGTTTADALWMGVPVVSLAGKLFIERLSATMLEAVGLDELIASDREDYIAKAVRLARDEDRRAALRSELRGRMAGSELCDAHGLATALEGAFRGMREHAMEAM